MSCLYKKLLKNFCGAVFAALSIYRLGYVMDDMGFHSQQAKNFSLFSRPPEYTVGSSCFSAGNKAWAIKLYTHLRVRNQRSYILLPLYAFIACIETYKYSQYLVDILEGIRKKNILHAIG